MKRLIVSLVLMSVVMVGNAQGDIRGPIANPAPGVLDGVYVKEHIPTKNVVPYEFVREADVAWSKRVWRALDMREKFNHPLYYPLDDMAPKEGWFEEFDWKKNPTRWSLWTIIKYHVFSGDLTAYSPMDPEWVDWDDGDLFKYPLTTEKFGLGTPGGTFYTDSVFRQFVKEGYFGATDYTAPLVSIQSQLYAGEDSINANGEVLYYDREYMWYNAEDVIQYRIKEDWFFDNERSVLDVRIIGICPVVYQKDPDGNIIGLKELFWLYFPECRYVLQNFFVQNRHNDSQRMSFDDLFWKRMFQSYIYKETNLYDRELQDYRAGIEALLESEKIKEKIFLFEHDLWSF